jgi:hypothetical protein
MMNRMMPMMSGAIEKMEFTEKEKMMVQMMPKMMGSMSLEEKMQMMRKMMPMMMADIDVKEMEKMMDTMMPTMMKVMEEKGIKPSEMMKLMCPKCVNIATQNISDTEKKKLKTEMSKLYDGI